MTESLSCDVEAPKAPPAQARETEFEKRRGVNRIETRSGLVQVHIEDLAEPIAESRLRVLRGIADEEISIDFLKLTPSGLSFLVAGDNWEQVALTLKGLGVTAELRKNRAILLVHAVNIRDEEGLIAEIVLRAIESGAPIDHIGDMHDRLLMIVRAEDADLVRSKIAERWPEAAR